MVAGNRGDGVAGSPAVVDSTIASNLGDGILFTAAGSVQHSNLEDCAPANICASAAVPGAPPEWFTVRNETVSIIPATSNYWGLATTAQMDASDTDENGANNENANITAIRDLFDDPT